MGKNKRKNSSDSDIEFGPSKSRRKRQQQKLKQGATRLLDPHFLECAHEEDAFDKSDAVDRPLTRSFMRDLCKSDNAIATPTKVLSNSIENESSANFQRSAHLLSTPLNAPSKPEAKYGKQKQSSSDIHPTQILDVIDEPLPKTSKPLASSIELDTVPVLKTPCNPPPRRDLNPNKRRNNSPIASNKRPRTINFKNDKQYSTTDHQKIFGSSTNGNESIETGVDTSSSNNVTENVIGSSSEGSILSNFYLQLGQLVERFKENGRHVLAAELENAYKKDERRFGIMNSLEINSTTLNFATSLSVDNTQQQCTKTIFSSTMSARIFNSNINEGKPIYVKCYPPSYELVSEFNTRKKTFADNLIIFANNERTLCYRYRPKPSTDEFICEGCITLPRHAGKTQMSAKFKLDDAGKEYVELPRTCHHCQPISYQDIIENANRLLHKPDFELIEHGDGKRHINAVVELDEEQCICNGYRFCYEKISDRYMCTINTCKVQGYLTNLEDGEQIFKLSGKHTCQIRPLRDCIIRPPMFVKTRNGRILVFSKDDSRKSYEYKRPTYGISYCVDCFKLGESVNVRLCKDGNNEYLKCSTKLHICKPIVRKPEFENFAIKNLKRPKRRAGNKGLTVLGNRLSKDDKHAARAQTYIATLKGPDAPLIERYSASFYIGKANHLKKRLRGHWKDQSIVGQMMKKHGNVYLVPIYTASPARCFDMEGVGIELRRQGTIDFPFFNKSPGSWNSNTLKEICENVDHAEHGKFADGFKRLVYEAMKKTDAFVSGWNEDDQDILSLLNDLDPKARKSPSIALAIKVHDAYLKGHHIKLFKLYKNTPRMCGNVMDLFLDRERRRFIKVIRASYHPFIEVSVLSKWLNFDENEFMQFMKAQGIEVQVGGKTEPKKWPIKA